MGKHSNNTEKMLQLLCLYRHYCILEVLYFCFTKQTNISGFTIQFHRCLNTKNNLVWVITKPVLECEGGSQPGRFGWAPWPAQSAPSCLFPFFHSFSVHSSVSVRRVIRLCKMEFCHTEFALLTLSSRAQRPFKFAGCCLTASQLVQCRAVCPARAALCAAPSPRASQEWWSARGCQGQAPFVPVRCSPPPRLYARDPNTARAGDLTPRRGQAGSSIVCGARAAEY